MILLLCILQSVAVLEMISSTSTKKIYFLKYPLGNGHCLVNPFVNNQAEIGGSIPPVPLLTMLLVRSVTIALSLFHEKFDLNLEFKRLKYQ